MALWGGAEEVNGIGTDAQGNVWNKAPTLRTEATGTFIRNKSPKVFQAGYRRRPEPPVSR